MKIAYIKNPGINLNSYITKKWVNYTWAWVNVPVSISSRTPTVGNWIPGIPSLLTEAENGFSRTSWIPWISWIASTISDPCRSIWRISLCPVPSEGWETCKLWTGWRPSSIEVRRPISRISWILESAARGIF